MKKVNLFKSFISFILLTAMIIAVIPAFPVNAADTKKLLFVLKDNTQTWSSYSSSSTKLGTEKQGERYEILASKVNSAGNLWYQISKKPEKWIYSGNVLTATSTPESNKRYVYAEKTKQYVRKGPASDFERLKYMEALVAPVRVIEELKTEKGTVWYFLAGGGYIYDGNVAVAEVVGAKSCDAFVVDDNTPVRKGPADLFATLKKLSALTFVTVDLEVKNKHGNTWCMLSDGSYVYKDHICIIEFKKSWVEKATSFLSSFNKEIDKVKKLKSLAKNLKSVTGMQDFIKGKAKDAVKDKAEDLAAEFILYLTIGGSDDKGKEIYKKQIDILASAIKNYKEGDAVGLWLDLSQTILNQADLNNYAFSEMRSISNQIFMIAVDSVENALVYEYITYELAMKDVIAGNICSDVIVANYQKKYDECFSWAIEVIDEHLSKLGSKIYDSKNSKKILKKLKESINNIKKKDLQKDIYDKTVDSYKSIYDKNRIQPK